MSNKIKIEIPMLLPQDNGCESCWKRLEERVQAYGGIELAHLDQEGETPYFCIHYDPDLINLDIVRAIAIEEGAHLEWRYRHETLPVQGLDCADCARTLENGVGRLDGVLWVSANFAASSLAVEYDVERTKRPEIVSRIQALGYDIETPVPSREMIYQVDGMDCADCALNLEKALSRTPGVAQVSVDFTLARLRLTPDDGVGINSTVQQVAEGLGYSLRSEEEAAEGKINELRDGQLKLRERLSAVSSRLHALQEMEQSREGLRAGTRAVRLWRRVVRRRYVRLRRAIRGSF